MKRENETVTQFAIRQILNEMVEKIADWVEEYGSNDPGIVAKSIRREFKDE